MKFTYYKKQIVNFIYKNKLTLILLLICLVAGIAAGSIFSAFASEEVFDELGEYLKNFVSAYSLQIIDSADVVNYSLLNNGKTVIIVFLSCIWRGFVLIPFLDSFILGFRFGFATTSIIRLFGTKGIPLAVVCSIPQMLLFAPIFILYCVYNIKFTLSGRNSLKQGFRGSVLKLFNIKNMLLTMALVFIVLITALVDGYVVPFVLKPVCAILG